MAVATQALGVVLAGGGNRRYGSHKALASVAGVRLVDRVTAALGSTVDRVVLVANEIDAYSPIGLPVRPDARPGTGVLGGILTGVSWAAEDGLDLAVVVACDMPFLPASLLKELVERGGSEWITIPASDGPRGMEPLCAAYGVGCLPAIEAALDRGDRAVVSFLRDVAVRRLELEAVRRHGDPAHIFLNVNRPEDRERAERLLGGRTRGGQGDASASAGSSNTSPTPEDQR
jgi:molybdopterin-guanine dinucleotide biosynthesis protein A